ncbi:MAG: zinc-ribbon domain-containing protein [bacterium]
MTGLPLQCPGCGARYLLPPSLLGDVGAQVRCPACAHSFNVDVNGAVVTPSDAVDPRRAVARAVLDELAARLGGSLDDAARDRRLFAQHGPDLMAAWDEYRRRAGSDAPSRAFREELSERFGVELFPQGSE